MTKFALAVLACLPIAAEAKADPAPLPPELKAFLMRPEQLQMVTQMMTHQWQTAVENCTTAGLEAESGVMIAVAPTFDASGTPISGRWRVIGHAEGCGQSRRLGVEYLFTPDGQMRRIGTLPGTTIADLNLQRDSLMYAMLGMVKLAPQGCKDVRYVDTKFLQYDAEGTGKRPWTEDWTVRSCGVTGIVAMHFKPDATGTTIVSRPDETRLVGP